MQPQSPYKVLILDDHPMVVDGLKTMLDPVEQIELQTSLKTGQSMIQYLRNHSADVLLLDMNLPDINGVDVCKSIRTFNTEIKIIGLSSYSERSIILSFMAAGANGYVLKNIERCELIYAIQCVMSGRHYFCATSQQVIDSGDELQMKRSGVAFPEITPRENEILQLVAQGYSVPDIAGKLFLSPLTISTHKKNLYKKFNANNVQTLLKKGREYGYIK